MLQARRVGWRRCVEESAHAERGTVAGGREGQGGAGRPHPGSSERPQEEGGGDDGRRTMTGRRETRRAKEPLLALVPCGERNVRPARGWSRRAVPRSRARSWGVTRRVPARDVRARRRLRRGILEHTMRRDPGACCPGAAGAPRLVKKGSTPYDPLIRNHSVARSQRHHPRPATIPIPPMIPPLRHRYHTSHKREATHYSSVYLHVRHRMTHFPTLCNLQDQPSTERSSRMAGSLVLFLLLHSTHCSRSTWSGASVRTRCASKAETEAE